MSRDILDKKITREQIIDFLVRYVQAITENDEHRSYWVEFADKNEDIHIVEVRDKERTNFVYAYIHDRPYLVDEYIVTIVPFFDGVVDWAWTEERVENLIHLGSIPLADFHEDLKRIVAMVRL